MAAAARTHKIKLYSSEKGYYYGICFPSPSPIPSQNKGGNINMSQTLGEMDLRKKQKKKKGMGWRIQGLTGDPIGIGAECKELP